MTNFDVYSSMMLSQGVEMAHKSSRAPRINDRLVDGEICIIPKNVTFFNHNGVEFVVFPNEEGDLRRIYLAWLDNSRGTMHDSLEEYPTFEQFFADNEGRKFKVRIEDGNPTKDPFSIERPTKKYLFKWIK